jgi:hypothetical protein
MRLGKGLKWLVRTLGALGGTLALILTTTATAAVACANANTAGPPTLTHGVQPMYVRGNITKCPQGTTTFVNTSESRDHDHGDRDSGHSSDRDRNGGTIFQVTVSRDQKFLSFITNSPSFTVYVKGGPAFNIYDYTGSATHPVFPSDSGLHAPLNGGGRLPDIGHYLACGQPPPKASPTLTTNPSTTGSDGSVVLNDTGILSDGASPTGSITFNLFDPSHSDCSGTPAFTQTLTVSGNGSYTTTNAKPASTSGTWSWTVSYTGDDNNNGASSTCSQEKVLVGGATPSLTTTPSAGGTVDKVVLDDTATLSGGASPTGSITFNLFDPSHSDCSGTPAFTQTLTVSGNGSYSTTNPTPADNVGTWSWTASYSGDTNNNAASSACGQETVSVKAAPSLTTTPSAGGTIGIVVLKDTAMISGGSQPGGTIIFNLYDPQHASCSGTPAFTDTVAVADASAATTDPNPPNAPGTWRWTATYSGDANNNSASTTCGDETVSVAMAAPSLNTTPSAGGSAGTVVLNDTGTVSGGFQPSGTIIFNLYDPQHADCSGTPAFSQTFTVSANGSFTTTNATPASMAGTWSWTASYSGDTNNNAASSGCTQETVKVGSCTSVVALSTLVSGTNVVSYVARGSWERQGASLQPGIAVVNVEGSSITNSVVPTGTDVINSCASNSVTGQTVCTANNNHVYVLRGTGLDPSVLNQPLIDGGSGQILFSGGSATTTGVAIDPTDNKALLALSVGSVNGVGVGGFQFLDLATNTFETPFAAQTPNGKISEAPLLDSVHNLILSATEAENVPNFEAINVATTATPQFFEHEVHSSAGEMDSTAADCSTGITFAPMEFTDPSSVEIADISNPGTLPNAVFTPGTPGSWTAPEQVQTLTGSSLSSGASASAVAQGTHTGVISGEVGGDALTALALPTTSGAGAVPAFSNWISCKIGNDPSGIEFAMGSDPHTLAAYQSPSGGDAIALLVNSDATEMVRVDLTKMLNLSNPVSPHVCASGTLDPGTESFIPLPPPVSST